MNGNAIDVRGVSKQFREPIRFLPWRARKTVCALQQVSFSVPYGKIFVLVGPNGAGKTTLLKILSTLLIPDSGEVTVHHFSLPRQADRIRALISFVLGEDRSFYWRLTARQNLEFFAALYNLTGLQARKKIEEVRALFDLAPVLDRPYQELSTGTRQRLALARSFLHDAPILLADEPTRSLDPLAKQKLRESIRNLSVGFGKTVVLSTHDIQEARELGDQVGILLGGRLRKVGPASDVLADFETAQDWEATVERAEDEETALV